MKIVKIEQKVDINRVLVNDRNARLVPVTVITKNWLGKYKKFDAYPTNYGPTYGSGKIQFYCYCDNNEVELSDHISKAINNYMKILEIKGLLKLSTDE